MNRREALAALLALPEVGRVERLQIQPYQTLVLTCEYALSSEQVQRLQQAFREALPGVKVLVLGDGMTLRVLEVID